MKTTITTLVFIIYNTMIMAQKNNTPQIPFEQLIQESWNQQETENVKVITDFIQNLMNNHNFDYIEKNFDNDSYIQHNRSIPDGIIGLISYVNNFTKRFPAYSYDVKKVIARDSLVIFHSHVTLKEKHRGNDKKGFIIMDMWKLKNGKITEHWDAIQPINGLMKFYLWIAGGKVRNENSIF